MKDVWKKFDETEPSHSTVHHLMAIYYLHKKSGYARGIDIAKFLNITRGSVSLTLAKVKEKDYIVEDQNKFYRLTALGQDVVNSVLSKRHIVKRFFHEVLGLPEDVAELDACKVEHLLSHQTGEKLLSFMGFYLSNQPIAKHFREEFHNFKFNCSTIHNCGICEMDCYFAGKEGLIQEV